ncbi:hypothetical protein [Streptomyces sp. P3]|uniref:hypothetical protein n=1 Tax=Streptomyces sp. P3 TaxID=2135430 RepID=UPI0015742C3D|nr:hypothetical protein [Streptomyces sp. P3]
MNSPLRPARRPCGTTYARCRPVARILAAGDDDDDAEEPQAGEAEPYEGPVPSDDDEDDELDGPDDDGDFYDDALEDA